MIGADADIAIWDPDKKVTLSHDLMQHGSDYTPYEGMEVTGWPIKTLLQRRARRRTMAAWSGRRIRPVPVAADDPEFVKRFAATSPDVVGGAGRLNRSLLFERTSVRVSRPISEGAKRRMEAAASPVRASIGSGMSMTSSKKA